MRAAVHDRIALAVQCAVRFGAQLPCTCPVVLYRELLMATVEWRLKLHHAHPVQTREGNVLGLEAFKYSL